MIQWNGKAEELPAEGVQFLYEDKRYVWHPCDCGSEYCKRPVVYNVGTETRDDALTTRARGTDQGNPVENVLLKTGIIDMERLVEINLMMAADDRRGYTEAILEAVKKFDTEFQKIGPKLLADNNVGNMEFISFMMALM